MYKNFVQNKRKARTTTTKKVRTSAIILNVFMYRIQYVTYGWMYGRMYVNKLHEEIKDKFYFYFYFLYMKTKTQNEENKMMVQNRK